MITDITIKGAATYTQASGVSMNNLHRLNFIYGANGAGKTTVSKLIADENAKESNPEFSDCKVTWAGGGKLKAFVYNQDFVKANFQQKNELKGVFTLGEDSIELVGQINALNAEINELQEEIKNLDRTLNGENGAGGKKGDLQKLTEKFYEKCWEFKKKHEGAFYNALVGSMGSKKAFAEKMLREWGSNNQAEVISLEELETRAETIYSSQLEKLEFPQQPDFSGLLQMEKSPLLTAKIIGKDDVYIAGMIQKLNNSDWVHQGLKYLDASGHSCPFCQQELEPSFHGSLKDYFDETYASKVRELDDLLQNYSGAATSVKDTLDALKEVDGKYIHHENLKSLSEFFNQKVAANLGILAKKKSEPSAAVELESLHSVAQKILEQIEEAKNKIEKHNSMIDNLDQEKELLVSQIWRFLIHYAQDTIKDFISKRTDLDNAINNIEDKIDELGNTMDQKIAERQEKEKEGASVKPTVNAMNKMLKNCGFRGFKLEETEKEKSYKIVRFNGEDAHATLSEGEKNFIAFLYFFYLADGSHSQIGVKDSRVVVFDDPVSSLDSETLFVVGALIKSTFKNTVDEQSPIQQIFMLTHNIYFFKEVTLSVSETSHSFWIVRKKDNESEIERHKKNPVKSAYRMLWDEVKQDEPSSHTIRNTLRRILEYYFTMIGDKKLKDLPMFFEGDERHLCQSLISWLHGGSHFADDDDLAVPSSATIEKQLAIFKKIFEKTGHIDHYNMMRET